MASSRLKHVEMHDFVILELGMTLTVNNFYPPSIYRLILHPIVGLEIHSLVRSMVSILIGVNISNVQSSYLTMGIITNYRLITTQYHINSSIKPPDATLNILKTKY